MGMYVKSLAGLRKDKERTRRLGDRSKYTPTLTEIRKQCAKIREGWTEAEKIRREAYPRKYHNFLEIVSTGELFELEWFESMADRM